MTDLFFDAFWCTFPRREGKGDARKAWAKALKLADINTIVKGAERYRDDPNRDQSYTKLPASWLRAECWEDDPLPPRAKANGQPTHLSIPASQRRADEERIRRERREHAERLAGEGARRG